MALEPISIPQTLPPCGSRRRRNGDSNSPEFEFWMIRNPSIPQPNLLSADELFSDGFLLPLRLLNHPNESPGPPPAEPEEPKPNRVNQTESSTVESASPRLTSSKRWTDIFKKSDKKSSGVNADCNGKKEIGNCNKEKKREKKNGGVRAGAPELNINIWPFSRSRSAGNDVARPRAAVSNRKASSEPCSRSNSSGESKSRKWPSSPSRAGVHLGRSSPVWQVRRSGGGGAAGSGRSSDSFLRSSLKGMRKDGNEGRRKTPVAGAPTTGVLSFNVPTCTGYRHHLGCRSEETSRGGDSAGEGVRGSNLFSIRSLFTKKVY